MSLDAVITIKNLSLKFHHNKVLFNDLNLQLMPGKFYSLLGPSGCGKSSLLRILAGLENNFSGKVFSSEEQKAVVFQEPELLPWRTVLENINLAAELNHPVTDLTKILTQVKLEAATAKYPHELSGGMKMRTSLARALALNAKLLLLDEPFSALDEQSRNKLQVELRIIQQLENETVLFITHSLEEALFLSDHIFVMDLQGKIAQSFDVMLSEKRPHEIRYENEFRTQLAKLYKFYQGINPV